MKIGIVGLGLIGGSIFKDLKALGYEVIAVSKSQDGENIYKNYEVLKDCNLVFVCSAMNKTLEILDSLYKRMSILGRDLLLDTIPSIIDGTAKYYPQDENEVTFGLNVQKEEAKIDFSKTSLEVKNLVRGLNSVPGAYCILDGKRLKVYEVRVLSDSVNDYPCGYIVRVDKLVYNVSS